MAFSWRFSVTMEDRSQKARPGNATGVAGTVVAGEKSLEKPVYFERGESQRMLNLLGAPNKVEQGILEAIEYNKSYPIWVVSPAKVLKRSYIMVTQSGTTVSFNAVSGEYMVDNPVDDGSFTAAIDFDDVNSAEINREGFVLSTDLAHSMNIYLESDPTLVFTINAAGTEFSGGDIQGTISTATAKYTLSVTSGTIASGDHLRVEFTRKFDTAVLYLLNRSVGQSLSMKINAEVLKKGTTAAEDTKYFKSDIYIKNYLNKTIKVSSADFALEKGAKDGFGNSLNAETVFDENDYVEAIYNPAFDNDTANSAYSEIDSTLTFATITRNDSWAGTDFEAGYDFFKKFNSYPVDLFFDATGNPAVTSKIVTDLRGGDVPQYSAPQPFASVVVPLVQASGNPVNTKSQAIDAIKTYPSNRGLSVYTGRFKIRNAYSAKSPIFEGVPMGEVAKRTADSIVLSYGGLATAWIDEAGVGGLLSGGRILGYAKNQEEFSEDALKELDEAKINAITYDYTYGPMIVSRRTTYADYSDYSFNDYSRIVDYCIKNILKNVFPYQAIKMNDEDHRAIVRMRTDAILQPLTIRPYAVLRDYGIKCDSENNNDEVLAREEFILEVAIKVTPKSRTLKLIFINAPQNQSIEAMFED